MENEQYRLMIHIIVSDFDVFEKYEQQAAKIMESYGGRIELVAEIKRESGGSGIECHLVSFSDKKSYEDYKKDDDLLSLQDLRARGINSSSIHEVGSKSYHSPRLVDA